MKIAKNAVVYVAGPMTGVPDHNVPAFNEMAKYLRAKGLTVRNPPEINPDPTADYALMMARCLDAVLVCNAAVFLDGWESSRGALIEFAVLTTIGTPCYDSSFRQIRRACHISTAPVVTYDSTTVVLVPGAKDIEVGAFLPSSPKRLPAKSVSATLPPIPPQ